MPQVGIFPSTFLKPVNGSKNSILNTVIKFNLFTCLFFLFVFEKHSKDFPFYSPTLLTLWLWYLQTHIKESCMYLSSQLFFKTSNKILKFQEHLQNFLQKRSVFTKHVLKKKNNDTNWKKQRKKSKETPTKWEENKSSTIKIIKIIKKPNWKCCSKSNNEMYWT